MNYYGLKSLKEEVEFHGKGYGMNVYILNMFDYEQQPERIKDRVELLTVVGEHNNIYLFEEWMKTCVKELYLNRDFTMKDGKPVFYPESLLRNGHVSNIPTISKIDNETMLNIFGCFEYGDHIKVYVDIHKILC